MIVIKGSGAECRFCSVHFGGRACSVSFGRPCAFLDLSLTLGSRLSLCRGARIEIRRRLDGLSGQCWLKVLQAGRQVHDLAGVHRCHDIRGYEPPKDWLRGFAAKARRRRAFASVSCRIAMGDECVARNWKPSPEGGRSDWSTNRPLRLETGLDRASSSLVRTHAAAVSTFQNRRSPNAAASAWSVASVHSRPRLHGYV
jgi:hypothetical protein